MALLKVNTQIVDTSEGIKSLGKEINSGRETSRHDCL